MRLRPASLVILLIVLFGAGPSFAKGSLAMAWFKQTETQLEEVDNTLAALNQKISELEQNTQPRRRAPKNAMSLIAAKLNR